MEKIVVVVLATKLELFEASSYALTMEKNEPLSSKLMANCSVPAVPSASPVKVAASILLPALVKRAPLYVTATPVAAFVPAVKVWAGVTEAEPVAVLFAYRAAPVVNVPKPIVVSEIEKVMDGSTVAVTFTLSSAITSTAKLPVSLAPEVSVIFGSVVFWPAVWLLIWFAPVPDAVAFVPISTVIVSEFVKSPPSPLQSVKVIVCPDGTTPAFSEPAQSAAVVNSPSVEPAISISSSTTPVKLKPAAKVKTIVDAFATPLGDTQEIVWLEFAESTRVVCTSLKLVTVAALATPTKPKFIPKTKANIATTEIVRRTLYFIGLVISLFLAKVIVFSAKLLQRVLPYQIQYSTFFVIRQKVEVRI